jgi:hypothetical protein
MVFEARNKRYMLIDTLMRKPVIHKINSIPEDSFALARQM